MLYKWQDIKIYILEGRSPVSLFHRMVLEIFKKCDEKLRITDENQNAEIVNNFELKNSS